VIQQNCPEESIMSERVKETRSKTAIKVIREEYNRLLEESFQNTAEYKKGDVVEAPIIDISDKYIIVNLGGKYDAYADISEYADENGELDYSIGDNLRGYIVDSNEQGFVIGKSLTRQYVDKDALIDAYERKIPVSGKVYGVTKGGFNVDVLGARAFCPLSHISLHGSEPKEKYIGKTLDFQVIECSDNCRRVVVSHRQVLEAQEQEKKLAALEKLHPQDIIQGKVMRMTNFGAFVDLGDIEGLLHVSEISWQHIKRPQDVLTVGQEIEVKILDIKDDRIALSMRALQDNPFELFLEEYQEGDIVNCRVLRLLDFGAFVELNPGVEGLIPISEISHKRNISHPRELLKEGDYVEAQILRIDSQNQKISLSMRVLQEDPWDKIDEIVQIDSPFTGKVESSTNFGVFITVADGITGLLPRSRMRDMDSFNPGDEVSLVVTEIDKDNHRLTLDYPDHLPEEGRNQNRRTEEHFGQRDNSMSSRRNGKFRGDDEWRKYAVQKTNPADDNPFKDL
jgi:small subunit ribosomal protein S1